MAVLFLLVAWRGAAQTIDPGPQKTGFPKTLPAGSGAMRDGHPAIADLGLTPGHKSIIFGTSAHKLYVIKYDGTVAAGFPVTLPAEITSTAAVGDLDGDGIPDIVVGYGSTYEGATTPGGVWACRRDGTLLWNHPSLDFNADGVPEGVFSSPAIGDVDGDGLNEVAWGGFDAHVHLVSGATGVEKPGWPHFVRDTIFSSPALFDIDGDGRLDIVIGVDAHLEGPPYNTPSGGCLHVFRWDATEVVGFPQCVDQVITSSPAIGDINGDGFPEIVFGTGHYWPSRTHKVYALKCDGTAALGWPVSVDGQVFTSPALGDLDGDGIPDVVVTDDNSGPSATFHVYAFKGTGAPLWPGKVPKSWWGTTPNAGDPVIADVTGDSKPEILFPINTEVAVFSSTGAQLTDDGTHLPGTYSYYTPTPVTGVSVEDFEPDLQTIEVTAVSATPDQTPTASAKVYVWNPSVIARAVPSWGVYRQNSIHTGVLPGTPSCPGSPMKLYTVTPCRVIDTRGSTGLYGGPALAAQSQRSFTIVGNCAIPLDARAISGNVTVADATTGGDLRIFPGGIGTAPLASIINFGPLKNRANNAVLGLSAGVLTVQNDQPSGTVNMLLDVNGYFK